MNVQSILKEYNGVFTDDEVEQIQIAYNIGKPEHATAYIKDTFMTKEKEQALIDIRERIEYAQIEARYAEKRMRQERADMLKVKREEPVVSTEAPAEVKAKRPYKRRVPLAEVQPA